MSGQSSMPALADQLLTDFLPPMNRVPTSRPKPAKVNRSRNSTIRDGEEDDVDDFVDSSPSDELGSPTLPDKLSSATIRILP